MFEVTRQTELEISEIETPCLFPLPSLVPLLGILFRQILTLAGSFFPSSSVSEEPAPRATLRSFLII